MKKGIILTIIGIIIIVIGYLGIEMLGFTKGVVDDIPKNANKVQIPIESKTKHKLDTLDIDDYNLLFFHPSESEFGQLIKIEGENSGLYEVDSDFGFYINSVNNSLSKTNLKIKFITERIIKLKTNNGLINLDRLENKEGPYGVIFNSNNCEPRIEFGVMTDIDIFQIWDEYLKNCK